MKWNNRLKAMRRGNVFPLEKQNIPVMTTDINCQNSKKGILSVNGSGHFGHSSKFGFDLSPADLETILEEPIAIAIYDGGLSEAEAVRIAAREVRAKKQKVGTSWN